MISHTLDALIGLVRGPHSANQKRFISAGGLKVIAKLLSLPFSFEQPLLKEVSMMLGKKREEDKFISSWFMRQAKGGISKLMSVIHGAISIASVDQDVID